MERQAERRAERVRRRLSGRTDLTERQRDRLRRAEDTVLASRKRTAENDRRVGGAYFNAMLTKQGIEDEAEATAIQHYNDPTYQQARTEGIREQARLQASKDRTALVDSTTSQAGLGELQQQWETAFRAGDTEQLDALTNVMIARHGNQAANAIGRSLAGMQYPDAQHPDQRANFEVRFTFHCMNAR